MTIFIAINLQTNFQRKDCHSQTIWMFYGTIGDCKEFFEI